MKTRGKGKLDSDGIFFLLAILAVALVLGYYSSNKYTLDTSEYMSHNAHTTSPSTSTPAVDVSNNGGTVSTNNDGLPDNVKAYTNNVFSNQYEKVSGMNSGQTVPSNCVKRENIDPNSLLPNNADSSHDLSNLPSTSQDPNMLTITGSNLIGGVSQVLRNANLQVRSEPANPRVDVGPWQNTTIEPDLSRISFELGSTCGN